MIAGKLLENAEKLLDMNVHPTVITKGYKIAADKCQEILKEIAFRINSSDEEILRQIAMTAMTGKGAESSKEKFADIIVKAVKQIEHEGKIDINDISIPVDVNGKYVLPQIMQRYESLMFQDVWVYLKITGIRFLSLHDGLYFIDNVSEDTINDIKNIISKYIDVFFSFHYDKVENK